MIHFTGMYLLLNFFNYLKNVGLSILIAVCAYTKIYFLRALVFIECCSNT